MTGFDITVRMMRDGPERGGPEQREPERGGPERGGPERGGPEQRSHRERHTQSLSRRIDSFHRDDG
jgi:hypothetical protein